MTASSILLPKHDHKWRPNGTVTERRIVYSPVSRFDHVAIDETFSITVCECGSTRRVLVGRTDRWLNR